MNNSLLLALGLHQKNAIGAENDMIDVKAWKFEVMEDVIVVGQAIQGFGDVLFRLGPSVGMEDTLFELDPCLFKRLDGDEIEDTDPDTPEKMATGQ